MSRIRKILAVLAILLFILFHTMHIAYKVPFAFVNIVFLLVAVLGYFSDPRFSHLLGILAWPVLAPLFIFQYKADPVSVFAAIAVFNCMQMAVVRSRNAVKDYHDSWQRSISEACGRKKAMEEDLQNLKRFEQGVAHREMEIIDLYEVTRRMSEKLKLDGMFNILGSFLKENFGFRRCCLIVLGRENDEYGIDRIYDVWQGGTADGGNGKEPQEGMDYSALIKMLGPDPKQLLLSRETDQSKFKELKIDGEVVRFLAAPLLSETRIVGMLVIENLPEEDNEKFMILASQFALEIKKALLYETVERLSITDSVTGLYVRRYFCERLKEELDRSGRYKFKFALLVFDIDDFKSCNDSYGHLVGDMILKDISGIMKESVREIDIVARYGGEEFAVILSETPQDGAVSVAERIRKRVEEHTFRAYDEKLKVTVSIGISVYPKDSDDPEELIDRADMALYAAKKSGKNLVRTYKKEYNNL